MVTVVKILTAAIGVHVSLAITWEVTIIPALVSLYAYSALYLAMYLIRF